MIPFMNENASEVAHEGIEHKLRAFITNSFLPQSGLESFLIDSTGVLELLEFIEGGRSTNVPSAE
jgi:hypothetical protein